MLGYAYLHYLARRYSKYNEINKRENKLDINWQRQCKGSKQIDDDTGGIGNRVTVLDVILNINNEDKNKLPIVTVKMFDVKLQEH